MSTQGASLRRRTVGGFTVCIALVDDIGPRLTLAKYGQSECLGSRSVVCTRMHQCPLFVGLQKQLTIEPEEPGPGISPLCFRL